MRTHRPSKTAAGIAATRAAESMRPRAERLCHDPYAVHFLSPGFRLLRSIPPVRAYLRRRNDRNLPGMVGAIVARTRFMDDRLLAAAENGLEQLVILGAGYDCRAYRFDVIRKKQIRVFEVDHPATQDLKIRKLVRILGSPPNRVTFVPVRFNRESLAARLLAAGYDARRRSFFIWEGVTMYLSLPAVEATLAFVTAHSPPGSAIVFDCFPPSVVEGRSDLPEARALRRNVALMGEPLRFGLEEDAIPAFLEAWGFRTVEVLNSRACKPLYFKGPNAQRPVSAIFSFVHAEVANREGRGLPSGSCAN